MRTPRRWTIQVRDKFRTFGEAPASRARNVKALRGRNGMVLPRFAIDASRCAMASRLKSWTSGHAQATNWSRSVVRNCDRPTGSYIRLKVIELEIDDLRSAARILERIEA